jgi:hypothetical protein
MQTAALTLVRPRGRTSKIRRCEVFVNAQYRADDEQHAVRHQIDHQFNEERRDDDDGWQPSNTVFRTTIIDPDSGARQHRASGTNEGLRAGSKCLRLGYYPTLGAASATDSDNSY